MRAAGGTLLATVPFLHGCRGKNAREEIIVYCGVDEPYASQVFKDFEQQSGLRVAAQYDIESSKSVGLAGKMTAEKDHPSADVWWGSEAFLSVRLAREGILQQYQPSNAAEIPPEFKDPDGYWTGVGLRARVLAVGTGKMKPDFEITSVKDLADPRVKDKACISIPTAGATGAHMAALYVNWGPDRARAFLHKLQENKVQLLGGNAEVARQVGDGTFMLGLTDSDDCSDALKDGGKLSMIVPDQNDEGTLAMPTTVGLVKGGRHEADAKKLIDFLLSKQTEQKLIDLNFAKWGVRSGLGGSIKSMKIDYAKAADVYAQAQQEATMILQGRM
jgi:iron(III) transport system substrate-binding protein